MILHRRNDGTISVKCATCPQAQSPWVKESGNRRKLSEWVNNHTCE